MQRRTGAGGGWWERPSSGSGDLNRLLMMVAKVHDHEVCGNILCDKGNTRDLLMGHP